ncbi:hypothetical protein [Amaricoccus sp.]|uniref:hypothetical protein n=1 Tax=Amaricoccus sp. TaxID=1872485 RepID=UPI001B569A31|nr:hypothetical protein [Amaricoccus sp.]MBP7001312.1 hypothetical protein [Amaricoccus sp.]
MRTIGAALVGLGLAGAASAAPVSALGTWVVTKVENDPGMRATALVDDDPSYLGAVLRIAPSGITWDTGRTNGEGTYDGCAAPRLAPGAGGVAVTCGGAAWGPGATLTPLGANRLRLDWYDGGVLTLTRD